MKPKFLKELQQLNPSRPQAKLPTLDVRYPARFYPQARKMKRKVYLHVGPTNSGKSYTALQSFKAASSGFYAGPLRMLAREIFDRLSTEHIPCNLVTGDECINQKKLDGSPATLHAGTVEMIDLGTTFDVAVLDEIQMINDPSRGWAWSQAFLGVKARELHLCGDKNAENIIKQLCHQTGDELHVKHYKRLSPLKIDERQLKPTNWLSKLEPGDCIVCFSARKVKNLRDEIVQKLGKKCAVIYGSLPPETRATQARLFNDPNSDVDYLVASDAIGMGLNLAIKRIIMFELNKFDGEKMTELTIPQIKQIAGRAGRFKPASPNEPDTQSAEGGLVTTLNNENKRKIKHALSKNSPGIYIASYQPPAEAIRTFALDKKEDFTRVLEDVFVEAKIGPAYERPRIEQVITTTKLIDHVEGLTLDDRITLGNAPVKSTPIVQKAFIQFCTVIGRRESKNILQIFGQHLRALSVPHTAILQLEDLHKCITLFQWLSIRYPCNLLDYEGAGDLKTLCESMINKKLESRKSLGTPMMPKRTNNTHFKRRKSI